MLGYRTYWAGSFDDLDSQQGDVTAQEQLAPEGALMSLEVTFAEDISADALQELNIQYAANNVPRWPGYAANALVDSLNPRKIYVCWVKGFAFSTLIIGILLMTVLPVILGGILWMFIPEDVQNMIMMMGMMLILVPIMDMFKGGRETG
jgi:hypothetical protein